MKRVIVNRTELHCSLNRLLNRVGQGRRDVMSLGPLRAGWVLLLLISPLPAQAPGKQVASTADFSKEAVVGEHMETAVVFQGDGTYTREQRSRIRIQSDAGVSEYAILRPPYQTSLEAVEILDVRVTKPNGSVVVSPLDAVQDAPSQAFPGAAEFGFLRERHVPVKGLEAGDVLEYAVRWRVEKPLAPGQFWFAHQFLKTSVLLDEQLSISVPADRGIKVKSQVVETKMREEGGRRIYTWKTANLASQSVEKMRDVLNYYARRGLLAPPDVMISTFQSWEEVGRWYEGLQREKIEVTPEVKAKAEEVTKGISDENGKLRALYDYVSLHYHYVAVAFGIGRYQPHSAAEILANQYGDCKDKHVLLATLLSAIGIHAYAAMINSSSKIDPDVPMPMQFDHVVSVVGQGSKLLWMDTTPEVAAMGYLARRLRGKPALVIMAGKVDFLETPADPPFRNRYINRVTAKLDPDGTLQAHVEAAYRGDDSELTFRTIFRRVPQAQWKEMAQKQFYGGLLGGTITRVESSSPDKTDEPFKVIYDYTLKDFSGNERHRFVVPLSPMGIPEFRDTALSRTTPIWLGDTREAAYECRIELPKGWSAAQPMRA